MEFIAREVKRSKKKKRLHAFPPDKPDFNSKGLYILKCCLLFHEIPYLARQKLWFCGNSVAVKGLIIKFDFFPLLDRKISKNEKCCCWWLTAQGIWQRTYGYKQKSAKNVQTEVCCFFKTILPYCNGLVIDELQIMQSSKLVTCYSKP